MPNDDKKQQNAITMRTGPKLCRFTLRFEYDGSLKLKITTTTKKIVNYNELAEPQREYTE